MTPFKAAACKGSQFPHPVIRRGNHSAPPKEIGRAADMLAMGIEQKITGATVVDEQSCSVYLQELHKALGHDIVVAIFDADGQKLWSPENELAPPSLYFVLSTDLKPISSPIKRDLGTGRYAYDFPLDQPATRPLVLRILMQNPDPPSLSDTSALISASVQCLARQIDIATRLASTSIVRITDRRESDLVAQINAHELETTLGASAQTLAQACHASLRCQGVAIALPGRKILVSAPNDWRLAEQLPDIVARLHNSAVHKRKILTARFAHSDEREQQLVCSPIFGSKRDVIGTALIIDHRPDQQHARIARALSSKIATLALTEQKSRPVLNRAELVERIRQTQQRQPKLPHSLLYFDVDKVHAINDAFGYSAGDNALSIFRRILLDSAGANDAVAHVTSDRFALFMAGASVDTAVAKAEQVLRFLGQESVEDTSKSIQLSASAGIASASAGEKDGEELLIIAEVAARGAKERGGNQLAVYHDVDNSIIQRRSDVDKVGFLQMALIENRFTLFAQRIVAINAESHQKFELLTRLGTDGAEAAHPGEMLSAAERYHMMTALDRWVINSALTSISAAENTLEVNLSTFCINVSAQSLQDDAFIDHVEARIAETGVPPDTLCFEITETSLVRHINRAQRFIHRLQRLGCQVALDDFGTGYSSFSYLKSLPVNFLKIDGSFVRDILENPLSRTIVTSIVSIAEVIGATTVAEHVESELVRMLLKELGVHYVQGFAVHRPEPLAGILANMDSSVVHAQNEIEMIDLRDYTGARLQR